MKKGSLPNNF